MKSAGVIMAVAATSIIVLAIGIFSFLPGADFQALPNSATVIPLAVAPDTPAVQAAFAAREALIQTQIQQLDQELAARESDYQARAAEMSALIMTGEGQLAGLQQQETALQQQVDQLLATQSERATVYDGQRQQAYYQYQVNIQQLKVQLDEATAKLADAQAQLGQ